MFDTILQSFQYSFMQRALIEVLLISFLAGIIGTFLVLKNSAFITEGLSHGVYPGIVISFLLNINLIIGAVLVGMLAVIGISITSQNKKIKENTSIAIFFSSLFAIGLLLRSFVTNNAGNLADFITGNILSITTDDIIITLFFVFAVLLIFFVFYREFLLSTFDPIFAQSLGINVKVFDILFNIIVSISVVISITAVGNILVVALFIIPGATSRLLNKNVAGMMVTSITITLISGVLGLLFSNLFNIAAGASIVLVSSLIFFSINFIVSARRL